MRKSAFIQTLLFLFFCMHVYKSAGQGTPAAADTDRAPQTFAMIMGISTYKYIRPLAYADKDAELFRDFLKSPAGGKIKDDNIYCLLNEQAMAANFWVKGMAWLRSKNLKKGDKLFFYLAGHGDAINQDEFFFLTYDCNPAGDKNNYIVTGNVQLYTLKSRIGEFSRKGVEVYFIMDACRTNELPGGSEGQQQLSAAISEKRAGEIIMLATGAGQESLEDASIGTGHGLFTYYLVDGLNGMADTVGGSAPDNQITLAEIQKYVDMNVPAIAEERFRRKQDPFFCCNENSEKVVALVDTAYLNKWKKTRALRNGGGTAYSPRGRGVNNYPDDTTLIHTYNQFNAAIKDNRLTGANSAEFFYNQMAKKYPGTSYTSDAQATLAVEFINFAQEKINLYLECRDASSVQKIRAQLEESEKTDETASSLDRLEKVAQQEFSDVGTMLEKAIGFIAADDPAFAKSLQGRMYFFKARGYFGKNRRLMDIGKAFQYAYAALSADRNAAYTLNTLASLHFDNNNTDSAIYYAKKAIGSAPQWRYPYVTLAYAYKGLGKVDSALNYYRRAIQLDPTNADAYVDLGHYFYSLSRADSAIANYQRALILDPGNVYASNNIGWLNYERKNYDEAIRFFRQSISSDPRFISAYNGISKAFVASNRIDSARIYFAKAFANYQDKSVVDIYIGNFYKDVKLYDSAKSYYRSAIRLDPTYEEGWNNMGRISYDTHQLDSANFFFKKALVVNPSSAFSLINLGLVFKELKRPDSTYSYFQRAIRAEPFNAGILNNIGVIYTEDNSLDSAKIYFKKALGRQPDYRPAYNNLMKVYRQLGQLDSITNYLKTLPQFDPNSISQINDLGLLFMDQKRYDSARNYYHRALTIDPQNPQLFNNLGLVMRELKMIDSAQIYLQRSVQLGPDNVSAMINLSNVFRQEKQYDSAAYYFREQLGRKQLDAGQVEEAMAYFFQDVRQYDSVAYYFKRILQRQPGQVVAANNVGTAYMNMDQPDSALHYYQLALALDPSNATATLNIGLLYHSLHQYDKAVEYLEKATQLNPKAAKTYFSLGCAYALAGNPVKAVEKLRLAYEKGYKNYNALMDDPDLAGMRGNADFRALLDKYVPKWKERE